MEWRKTRRQQSQLSQKLHPSLCYTITKEEGSSTRRVGAIGRSPGTILLDPCLHREITKHNRSSNTRPVRAPALDYYHRVSWCPWSIDSAKIDLQLVLSFSRRDEKDARQTRFMAHVPPCDVPGPRYEDDEHDDD